MSKNLLFNVEGEEIVPPYTSKVKKMRIMRNEIEPVSAMLKIKDSKIICMVVNTRGRKGKSRFNVYGNKENGGMMIYHLSVEEMQEISKGKIPQMWVEKLIKVKMLEDKEMVETKKVEEVAVVNEVVESKGEVEMLENVKETVVIEEVVETAVVEDVAGTEVVEDCVQNTKTCVVSNLDVTEENATSDEVDVEGEKEEDSIDSEEEAAAGEESEKVTGSIEDVIKIIDLFSNDDEDVEEENSDILLTNEIKKSDKSTAWIARAQNEYELWIKAISSYSKNQRYYLLFEKNAEGVELGALNYAAKIEASKLEKKSNVVTDYIKNMSGNYNGKLGDIQLKLQQIEKYRMLKHEPVLDADSSTSFGEFYEKLKLFILHNVLDSRISVFTVKNITHVAIIRTTDKTLMQVFKDICREIDESVNPNVIKAELYSRGLLHHDNNLKCRDCQLTISSAVREQIGSRGDKVISIKFDDDFVEKVKFAYSVGSIEYVEEELEEYFEEEVM